MACIGFQSQIASFNLPTAPFALSLELVDAATVPAVAKLAPKRAPRTVSHPVTAARMTTPSAQTTRPWAPSRKVVSPTTPSCAGLRSRAATYPPVANPID